MVPALPHNVTQPRYAVRSTIREPAAVAYAMKRKMQRRGDAMSEGFSKTFQKAVLLPLLFSLCQCQPTKPAKPGPYAYDLTLQLTPAAEAKLKASDRHFTVDAYYYGMAKPEYRDKADKLNRLDVGYDKGALDARARRIHMTGDGIDTSAFPQIMDGAPYVLITIRTATKASFPDELLYCHNYAGTIKDAQIHPPVIGCDTQY